MEVVDTTAEEVNMNEVKIIGMVHRVSRNKREKGKKGKMNMKQREREKV